MIKNEFLKRIISSAVLLPLISYIIAKGSVLFDLLIVLCFFISIHEWYKISINKTNYLFGVLFLALSFYSVYFLRHNSPEEYFFFIIVGIICIMTDIGGYVFGKLFKGPKLLKISPNKTISGMFGSFFSPLISIFFFINIEILNQSIIQSKFILIVFILFISAVSQAGDIFISYFKRLSDVKDTGKIIPGHGGLLDRIDGMIFSFPVSLLILKIIQLM